MQASSVPPLTRQRIQSAPTAQAVQSNPSSGYLTVSTSWTTTLGYSSGPDQPPMAWSGVRHQVQEDVKEGMDTLGDRSIGEFDPEYHHTVS